MKTSHDHLQDAIGALADGSPILLHDSGSRENEVDMVFAAQHVSPESVRMMRRDAGGLICLAVASRVGETLGLPFMRDIFGAAEGKYSVLKALHEERAPYGDKSAFSVTFNHKRTYTGVTDKDRALSILEFGKLCRKVVEGRSTDEELRRELFADFKVPGHVHLLLEAKGSLEERRGHTEMSVYLCRLAGMAPAAAICEMLDGRTYNALSVIDATAYARENSIPMLDGEQVLSYFSEHPPRSAWAP